jgi:hypothetical protein
MRIAGRFASPDEPYARTGGILQEFVKSQYSKALVRYTMEQEGKLLVMRHENICCCGGADCVLQITRSGSFRRSTFNRSSVDERHPKANHGPDTRNSHQFVETASLTLFGDAEGFDEREQPFR